MKDWKGNEIQEGQTILKVAVKGMFDGCRTQLMIVNKPVGEEFIQERQYLWEIVTKCYVKEKGDNSATIGGEVQEIGIDFLDFFFSAQPWEIICIEGVSDNKDDYYMNEFNV
jgi:hypothetical protein